MSPNDPAGKPTRRKGAKPQKIAGASVAPPRDASAAPRDPAAAKAVAADRDVLRFAPSGGGGPSQNPPSGDHMNAIPKTDDAIAFVQASLKKASPLFEHAAAHGAKNVEAVAQSLVAAAQGAEQLNAHLVTSATKAFSDAAATVVELAKVKTPEEAWRIHQRFVREAFDASYASLRGFGELLQSGLDASRQPLMERYNEIGALKV